MIKHALDMNYLVGSTIDALATTATTWVMEARVEDWMALCFLAAILTCVHIEFRWPFLRPGLRAMKQSYLTNVCTYLFNDITLSILSVPSLYLIAQQFSGHGLLSAIPEGPCQWFLTFLLLDLTLYGWHYVTHHFDGLWLFHKVHHSDRTFNVTTGLRFHMGELFLEVLIRVAFIALTGVSAEVVLINQMIISLFVLFHHTNCSFPYEHMLSRLIIVPRLHRRHHSVLRAEHDSNYGAVLSVWDRIFGTLSEGEPQEIGLVGVEEHRFVDLLRYGFGLQAPAKPQASLVPQSEESA